MNTNGQTHRAYIAPVGKSPVRTVPAGGSTAVFGGLDAQRNSHAANALRTRLRNFFHIGAAMDRALIVLHTAAR